MMCIKLSKANILYVPRDVKSPPLLQNIYLRDLRLISSVLIAGNAITLEKSGAKMMGQTLNAGKSVN